MIFREEEVKGKAVHDILCFGLCEALKKTKNISAYRLNILPRQ